jgi:hypothetical protein
MFGFLFFLALSAVALWLLVKAYDRFGDFGEWLVKRDLSRRNKPK